MLPPGAPPIRELNLFTQIDRPRRLALRSTLTMPDGSNIDRDVEVTFDEADGGTHMTVLQRGFPTEELRDLVGVGVSSMFDQLEVMVRKEN
jgi:Activator of Hsp90 ATPase homolog 1-like protein